jgi:sugar-specific transcriptional regulator TrmB
MAEEEMETLKLLGLSPTQVRIYLTLVKTGKATARTLATISNTTRPEVYRTMSSLQKLGLAQKIISVPVIFEATHAEHALTALVEDKTQQMLHLGQKVNNLINKLVNREKEEIEAEHNMVLIPPKKVALIRRKQLIHGSRKTIDMIQSWKFCMQFFSFIDKHVDEAIERGVKIRILVEKPKCDTIQNLKDFDSTKIELRYIDTVPQAVLSIYDSKDVLMAINPDSGFNETPLLWTDHNSIVSMATNYFENLWKQQTSNLPSLA